MQDDGLFGDPDGRGDMFDTPFAKGRPLSAWGQRLLTALRSGEDANTLTIGDVPEILRAFGGRGKSLVVAIGKLRKVLKDHRDVRPETFLSLPELLARPVYILRNRGDERSGDLMLVTRAETEDGDVIVAIIKRSGKDDVGTASTVLVTVYDKQDIAGTIDRAARYNDILFVWAEREGNGYRHIGADSLNASLSDTIKRLRVASSIRTPRSVFKRGQPSNETGGSSARSRHDQSRAGSPRSSGKVADPDGEIKERRTTLGGRVAYEPTSEFDAKAKVIVAALQRRLDSLKLSGLKVGIAQRLFVRDEDGNVIELDGYADPQRGLVAVALAATRGTDITLGHEALHVLKGLGLFRDAEWAALVKAARADTDRMDRARLEYKELSEAEQIEEVIADMLGEWWAGRSPVPKGFLRTAYERLRAFIEALGRALRGQGFHTWESVFRSVERGDVGRRYKVGKPIGNGSGVAVVGEAKGRDGILAYHGSPHDFDRFDISKIGSGEGAQVRARALLRGERGGGSVVSGHAGGTGLQRPAARWRDAVRCARRG
ncbi:hypothetical protein HNP73_000996 [Amaricoccus macauensis]|uniref:Phage MuF C-terminal domain-containing protein n=1 Tax=Amaricoccus macauensis TaxID=57001 RepID=A0A840SKA4_9RHOB|nr:hypothetical protein [Amaricoccus macauensis]MBB5221075.1 hypothetical protein [Amaricoccus macauensis]